MLSDITKLTQELVQIPSISPYDKGCQKILIDRLLKLDFNVEEININNTNNFWAYKGSGKTFAFLGHTDVVPPGNLNLWNTHPFQGIIKNNCLYGRGAADMKGSLAAMIIAIERFFLKNHGLYKGRIAFLVTSDEEDKGIDGIAQVINILKEKKEKIDYCLVGEPTSTNYIGDIIKNGRRGSVNIELVIKGIQGHIAYPHLSINPIHKSLPFLVDLMNKEWDQGNHNFPPTMLQISNIKVDTEKNNVTPGEIIINFNLRTNGIRDIEDIKNNIQKLLSQYNLKYSIYYNISAKPYFTKPGILIDIVQQAVFKETGNFPKNSTSGGTSDGRFLSDLGSEVIELGLINRTIHQINENVQLLDLKILSRIYQNILELIMV
ncbi:succinyl-diaminopimelate desuccinylase [Buchnera aphidicola (Thelaxes californica)]|uniref:Succinyl-diaminopimelate desuccinylase n=1 Tax=Buchnera aphidicola (Thelaxes californica) TaxID=1315998 RepID=A0A4D6YF03_9GAMM|nr:succinyl-diaminopimelate desuccinylase [Buchnera aphidicola]QCI26633.1 succinyl-diaminopimelate desuccinylase [Buchnera aphidicola (Thelaxes californica)]